MPRPVALCALALALLAGAAAVDSNNLPRMCKTCEPDVGCTECGTFKYVRMNVLNNNGGQLEYNRCSTCNNYLGCKSPYDCATPTNGGLPGCTQCSTGRYFKPVDIAVVGGTKQYIACGSCIADFNCPLLTSCDATNGCARCGPLRGKHPVTKSCVSCADGYVGCTSCTFSPKPFACTSCNAALFRTLNAGQCACMQGYKTCGSQAACIANNRCCVEGGDTCAPGGSCTGGNGGTCTCGDNYFNAGDGTCGSCPTNCRVCTAPGTTCTTCAPGFVNCFSLNGACVPPTQCCSNYVPGCMTCNAGSPPTSCATCGMGYTLTSGQCQDTNGCLGNPCTGTNEVCVDKPAPQTGYTCACGTGYTRNTQNGLCEDTNECVGNPCTGAYEVCADKPAPQTGYTCNCNSALGFVRDAGSGLCECGPGTQLVNGVCQDIDGCINHQCTGTSTCQDVPAPGTGYICSCASVGADYTYSGGTCIATSTLSCKVSQSDFTSKGGDFLQCGFPLVEPSPDIKYAGPWQPGATQPTQNKGLRCGHNSISVAFIKCPANGRYHLLYQATKYFDSYSINWVNVVANEATAKTGPSLMQPYDAVKDAATTTYLRDSVGTDAAARNHIKDIWVECKQDEVIVFKEGNSYLCIGLMDWYAR